MQTEQILPGAKSNSEINSAEDFLISLRGSGVLTRTHFDQVKDRVEIGGYPQDAIALACKLIQKRILTEYQARHLLHSFEPALTLGRYVILDRLGKGSMGRVFKARHRYLGRIVALKVINPARSCRPSIVARFRREMTLLGLMDHPNIVRAFDADHDAYHPYIAMEYVPGESLKRTMSRGPLPVETAISHAAQVAQGLAHAHSFGVVHRDIKPSNLMATEDGRVKILDFGVGTTTCGWGDDSSIKLINEGLSVGTAEYMSPEQARNLDLDGRSDLYSLGCVLYHLLTGRVPFLAASGRESLELHASGRHDPISEIRPDLPADLVLAVDRLMARRPEHRYQTASEAAEVLLALLG